MNYKITLTKPWNYRHPKKGRSVLAPGSYFIPEDLPEVCALRAIGEGMAQRVELPASMVLYNGDPKTNSTVVLTPKPRRKRAPRNKMRADAPENKFGLV